MLEVINDDGTVHVAVIDLQIQRKALEWNRFCDDDFNSVQGETLWERGFRRGDWRVKTVTRTGLTYTTTSFLLHAELDAYENDRRTDSRNWDVEIRSNLV